MSPFEIDTYVTFIMVFGCTGSESDFGLTLSQSEPKAYQTQFLVDQP